ncbi:MAG TPA: glycoside hydrolase family 2 protein [Bacteroidota bacterium]|jgi:beta-mannosidase|nr:glycoside hydrolase family 2 protein [Bacteroidota bacterium]
MKHISLNGSWKFKAVDPREQSANLRRWMRATVPGTVHTDLMANRRIRDPFYRMNELDVQWVDKQRWHYRRSFSVSTRFIAEQNITLVAEGLDTYAEVRINGKLAGRTSNMFVEHRFDAKKLLRVGTNVIDVVFDSPTNRSSALERRYGKKYVSHSEERVYVRKAQYSFGWDWGPRLTTSGIWRSMSLEATSVARIRDARVTVGSVNQRQAVIECSMEVEKWNAGSMELEVRLDGNGTSAKSTTPVTGTRSKIRIAIKNPQLWWPNGYGDQPMYSATFTLISGGTEISRRTIQFGIRTVRLVRQKDTEGESFFFNINGVNIYCKGADWIPSDSFLPRIDDSTYETLLRYAKNAHMNMIRVWGGGIYEQDLFYELCDTLGLMVWQDFMFACGEYPEDGWFLDQVQDEAEKVVARLRHHPSIVLWCGNNECEWLYCTDHPDASPDDMSGAKIFRDLLPAVCRRLDGTRPYWRSSPFGKGFPNDETNGNHHQWHVWSFWKDFPEYEKNRARFVSEFGFQAPANRRTFEAVTLPEDRKPQHPVIEHHNKQIEGQERLFRFQAAHYLVASDFNDFIYKGQLVQAEALKTAVEHWRRRKFMTGGSIFWQLNDCWPVSSWAVIDAGLRPKAAYYYSKKFFAPLLISLKKLPRGVEVWVTNDLVKPVTGTVTLTLRSFEGKILWRRKGSVAIPGNSSKNFYFFDSHRFPQHEPASSYLLAHLRTSGRQTSENRLYFVEPKYLRLPKARVRARLIRDNDGYAVVITAESFLKNVRVEIEGEDVLFDNNYFDMDASSQRKVAFHSNRKIAYLRKHLRLRWLES